MEKVIFNEAHFKQRLNDLRHYLVLHYDGSAYDAGYLHAITYVLNIMENN